MEADHGDDNTSLNMKTTRGGKAHPESRPLLRTTSSLVSEASAEMRAAVAAPQPVAWIRMAWLLQILVGFAVLCMAVWQNGYER